MARTSTGNRSQELRPYARNSDAHYIYVEFECLYCTLTLLSLSHLTFFNIISPFDAYNSLVFNICLDELNCFMLLFFCMCCISFKCSIQLHISCICHEFLLVETTSNLKRCPLIQPDPCSGESLSLQPCGALIKEPHQGLHRCWGGGGSQPPSSLSPPPRCDNDSHSLTVVEANANQIVTHCHCARRGFFTICLSSVLKVFFMKEIKRVSI